MVRDDINMFSSTKALIEANKNTTLQVNFINDAKKIMEDLKWHIRKDKHI